MSYRAQLQESVEPWLNKWPLGWSVAATGRDRAKGAVLVENTRRNIPNAVMEFFKADLSEINSIRQVVEGISSKNSLE
jgi:hypothetical protein